MKNIFAKICVFVENLHLENNNKVDCKNFEEHSRLCVPIHVYCVYATFRSKSYSTSSKIRFAIPMVCAGPLFKGSFRKTKA